MRQFVYMISLAIASFAPVSEAVTAPSDEAIKLTYDSLVVDGHNDLPWTLGSKGFSSLKGVDLSKPQPEFHTDIPRLRKGGVGLQFWSAYAPASSNETGDSVELTLKQIDLIHRIVKTYPDTFAMASTSKDVRKITAEGKIASMIGVEGGYSINNSLEILRMYYNLGVRYMTLTHSKTIEWADSATDTPKHGGLNEFGKNVVREMNRLGMLVDVSHVTPDVMRDVLDVSKAPIIASHSSAKAIADHPRNVPDDVLKRVAKNGGVIMVNFFSAFVEPRSVDYYKRLKAYRDSLSDSIKDEGKLKVAVEAWKEKNPMVRGGVSTVLDHIDHIVKVAGIDHVGLGSDYEGVPVLPVGLEDVSTFPRLTQGLLDRGYSKEKIRKILGENAMRALEEAEAVAAKEAYSTSH